MNTIALECPSGIAGNLFVTALSVCGVPDRLFESLPSRLKLPSAFTARKNAGVWDGYWDANGALYSTGGPVSEMQSLVDKHLSGEERRMAKEILRFRWQSDPQKAAFDECWCDTLFDACAAALGLSYLAWPEIIIVGPLPTGTACHPLSRVILDSWVWCPSECPVEIVTPTGAAILRSSARQADSTPKGLRHIGDVKGNFARLYSLPPMRIFAE